MAMEYVAGGELFDHIISHGKVSDLNLIFFTFSKLLFSFLKPKVDFTFSKLFPQ